MVEDVTYKITIKRSMTKDAKEQERDHREARTYMEIRISNGKKRTKRVDFMQFLSGVPAGSYVFQNTAYEELLEEADAVVIGAGAGLSTAAGLSYSGKRFTDNFSEFIERYGSSAMTDMYSAGFYPFPTEEEKWGYWSKHSYLNRIEPGALPLYQTLYDLVRETPHFVLTTNVDHQFWKAGFADEAIFATQGDYGEIQCARGCHDNVYDAVELFRQMNQARKGCRVPSDLVPHCPVCGGSMAMHLRCDQYFVEEEHWHEAAGRYASFLNGHFGEKTVLLELGVGFNTPTIIRFPFEKMVREHEGWSLVRLNLGEAAVPDSLKERAVGINGDILKSIGDIRNRFLNERRENGDTERKTRISD